jgi:hypothetical protein
MKTTINIHVDILNKITYAAQLKGVSCSEVIVILIKKVMDEWDNEARLSQLVQYQERSSPDTWHPFHINWKPDMYEYCLDLKKVRKMSVSLILAYAVKKYLKILLKKGNLSDNYHYQNYIIAREIIEGVVMLKLIWGFPPKLGKYLKLQPH